MSSKQGTLIIGASGLIGRYLFEELYKKGEEVIGTYNKNKKEGLIHFDILESSIEDLPIKNIKYGVICSAITKIDECKENQIYSHKVNVDGMKKIVSYLSEKGIIPVFMSSGAVFDGILGNYKENSKRNPTTVYGMQKKEIEDFLRNIPSSLIIRPGKVFGVSKGEGVLFTDWLEKYNKGEKILCADDEKLSPTYAGDVARGITCLLERDSTGIYHISFPKNYSRFELALKFFDYLSIKDAKIKKCSIDDFQFIEKRPKNPYLDASKFINKTDFIFTNLSDCFEIIKKEMVS